MYINNIKTLIVSHSASSRTCTPFSFSGKQRHAKMHICWINLTQGNQVCSIIVLKSSIVFYVYCVCFSIKAVYSELHHTLMSISEPDDLRWWKNNHGPGMPTDWPKLEVCVRYYEQNYPYYQP